MNIPIISLTINHPLAGVVSIEKQDSALLLSYQGSEQLIEWNIPEPLIAVGSVEGELCFTFFMADNAILKKKLYFNGDRFWFCIPDGISYYLNCEITSFPFPFFQAREGASIMFQALSATVNLQVDIEMTSKNSSGNNNYFTEYTLRSGNLKKSCRLYAGDHVVIGEYWFYQSPRATSWPVFLISNCALEPQYVGLCCP
ncbi:hypothetical protein ACWA06_04765 [Serratia rhizosphaerae]|uniref:hypothetical protein n=1 Tax=Serratia sp. Tan611 TaxID=2773264 RepID=UPI001932BC98|nr:hypothetical protein [Serratia sp. Tan611]CAE1147823.1 conserved protein of unknown function [Serratia sp. Tan611]